MSAVITPFSSLPIAAEAGVRKKTSKVTWSDALIYAPLVVTTILGKLSVPFLASKGLGVTYPILIVVFALGLLVRRVTVDGRRATYFFLLVAFVGLVHIFLEDEFSNSALLLFIAASVFFVLNVPRQDKGPRQAMRFFADFAACIAVCGIAQFFLQPVVGARYAFPIESFTPAGFLIKGFHYLNPLYYGASIYKSNGIFELEPSFFSQFMAVALIVEISETKRISRIALIMLATLLSYSGTGLLILLLAMPLALVRERRIDILLVLIGAAVLAFLFAVPLRLDVILSRVGELGSTRSSAAVRFINWWQLAGDSLIQDPVRALFGYGAGTFRQTVSESRYVVAEILHSKILEEYGILGFAIYVGFLMYCIFTAPFPIAVRVAIALMQFMNGAFGEPVLGITLSLLVLTPRANSRLASYPDEAARNSSLRVAPA